MLLSAWILARKEAVALICISEIKSIISMIWEIYRARQTPDALPLTSVTFSNEVGET